MSSVTMSAGIAGAVAMAVLVALHLSLTGRVVMFSRDASTASDFDIEPKWTSGAAADDLNDNIGANNLAITGIVKGLEATREQPNLAAALYKLETSTKDSVHKLDSMMNPSVWLGSSTPVMPDPEGLVHRMQRMRLSSRYCRLHPQSCKSWTAQDKQVKHEATLKARKQELFLDGSGNGADGMPWLAPYSGQHTQQSARDNSMWSDAHDASMEQPQEGKDVNVEDPLWCGAASCAEKSYARHQHEVAKGLGHLVHNEAAIKIGGERYATLPAAAGAGTYGYIPGTPIPTVFKKDQPRVLQARTQTLASVSSGNVFAGRGDSLLPHGHLWGMRNSRSVPRYHAYAGFYEGSQPDRAVVESPEQAAGEAYALEEKELADGMARAKLHKQKLMEAAKKVSSLRSPENSKDMEEGRELFSMANSKSGKVFRHIDRLSYRGASFKGTKRPGFPRMRGMDMSIVSKEAAPLVLEQEEKYANKEATSIASMERELRS